MYLHVTTRIEDQPHDGLFKKVGFTGFPSFGFMDKGGNLTAHHAGARSLEGFDTTGKKATAYLEMPVNPSPSSPPA